MVGGYTSETIERYRLDITKRSTFEVGFTSEEFTGFLGNDLPVNSFVNVSVLQRQLFYADNYTKTDGGAVSMQLIKPSTGFDLTFADKYFVSLLIGCEIPIHQSYSKQLTYDKTEFVLGTGIGWKWKDLLYVSVNISSYWVDVFSETRPPFEGSLQFRYFFNDSRHSHKP